MHWQRCFIPCTTFNPVLSQSGTCKKDSLGVLSARSSKGLISGEHKRGFFSMPLMVTNGFRARLPGWEKGSGPHMSVYTNKSNKVGLKCPLTMLHTVGVMCGNIYSHYVTGCLYQWHKFSTNPKTQDAPLPLWSDTKPVPFIYSIYVRKKAGYFDS